MKDPMLLFSSGNPFKSQKREIVFQEHRSKYQAHNPEGRVVCEIKIDGALITAGSRCDYGLWVEDGRLFLIELKGCDVNHACDQLLQTFSFFNQNYGDEHFQYQMRVVSTRVSAPNIQYSKQKLQKRTGLSVIIKNKVLEENI